MNFLAPMIGPPCRLNTTTHESPFAANAHESN
jgi:hypothetical protein